MCMGMERELPGWRCMVTSRNALTLELFIPQLRLFSARVLNENNEFDDEDLITTQMRQAIEYFRNTYGCRVFNASLGR